MPSINLSYINRTFLGNAENQTWWVRSKYATSVLCSHPRISIFVTHWPTKARFVLQAYRHTGLLSVFLSPWHWSEVNAGFACHRRTPLDRMMDHFWASVTGIDLKMPFGKLSSAKLLAPLCHKMLIELLLRINNKVQISLTMTNLRFFLAVATVDVAIILKFICLQWLGCNRN